MHITELKLFLDPRDVGLEVIDVTTHQQVSCYFAFINIIFVDNN